MPGSRREDFSELLDDWCFEGTGRRADEYPHFLELRHDDLGLNSELFGEFIHPQLRHQHSSRTKTSIPAVT